MKKIVMILAAVTGLGLFGLLGFYGYQKHLEKQVNHVLSNVKGTNAQRLPYEVKVHASLEPLQEKGLGSDSRYQDGVPATTLKPAQRDYQFVWDGKSTVIAPLEPAAPHQCDRQPEDVLLQATTDFEKFLPKLAAWKKEMSTGQLDGRDCQIIRATAPNGASNCTLWIDKEHAYISKGKIIIMGKHLCTTWIDYVDVGDSCLLPCRIITEYPLAKVKVTQVFDQHTITQ